MKTYLKPEVEILDLELTTEMLAGSAIEDGIDLDQAPVTNETSGNLARELLIFED